MKKQASFGISILILSSVLLLVILQVFWLKSSYEKTYFDLRRETNMIFRSTVFSVRDSLIARNIEAVPDSLPANIQRIHIKTDSAMPLRQDASVQIYVSRKNDADSRAIMRPLLSRIHTQVIGVAGAQRSFVIRTIPDSLNQDSLRLQFTAALVHASINLPVTIEKIKVPPPAGNRLLFRMTSPMESNETEHRAAQVFSDSLHTEVIGFSPLSQYAATLFSVRGKIMKEIFPQMLFSFFLTGMISLVFWMQHRNIRAQRRLMEVKNDFISNITHELKTPIATVSVALEALKNFQAKDNPKLTADYLDIAQAELERLTYMTDRILKTSVLEGEKTDLAWEKFSMEDLLHDVLASLKPVFEKREAKISVEKEGHDFTIIASRVHLSYTLYNLVDNALKYSPQKPEIVIALKKKGTLLELSVSDRGVGIEEAYQQKIFEKFFRVPTGDIHNIKGYGLGLSYVASVLKHHRGDIRLDSTPGKGSTFIVTLPVMHKIQPL
jgi:hypothetical protein